MTAPTPAGAPGAPAAGGTPTGQAPEGVQPPNNPAGGQQGSGTPSQATEAENVEALPAWAQKIIKDTREEAAKHRTGKETAAQEAAAAKAERAKILKALGLTPDGKEEPLTQEQIDAKLADASDDVWATKVENVVLRVKEVDVDKLWDSRAFVNSLDPFADLDPRSDEFTTKVTAHVKKYVADHPQFKASPPGAAKSGGDHPGGPGPGTRERPSLGAALAAKIAKRNSGT